MKKLFVFYGIVGLVFLFALILGLGLSFFIQVPSSVETLLQYTPLYVIFIILFFSILYNRDLHFARMGKAFPLVIFISGTLILTFWGLLTYLGYISSVYDVEKQFDNDISDHIIIESQDKNEYIYSWQEDSTDTTYTAYMPHDVNLDGIIVKTQAREFVNSDVYAKNYFDVFIMRFIWYHINLNKTQNVEYGQNALPIPVWIMIFTLLLIAVAFCMPVLASGLFLKRIFQLLFYINVVGIYNILLNMFIHNLLMIIVLSIVVILGVLLCVVLRIHNSFKNTDLEDKKTELNLFAIEKKQEELEEEVGTSKVKKIEVKNEFTRDKTLAYLFCIGVTIIWLLLVWFAFPAENILLFFLRYAIKPVLGLLFIIIAYKKRRMISKYFTMASLVTYIPVFFLYVLFLVFLYPNVNNFIQKTDNEVNFKKEIVETYNKAVVFKNEDEMFELSKFYKKKFPEDSYKFSEVEQFVGGKNVSIDPVSPSLQVITASESITPLNFTNLTRLELIQYIADYIEDGHFYAAKLLIVYYKNIYGTNTQRIIQFGYSIDRHIQLDVPSYSQQAKVQLQRQIQYLYNILSKQEVTVNVIAAYYQVIALSNGLPDNIQLQWLVSSYKELIEKYVFYAGDARLTLLKEQGSYPVAFVEKKEQSNVLWAAKDASYYKGTVYFKSLELLAIDQRPGRRGDILWHIKSSYAKLIRSRLMLYSLEYGNLYTRHVPEFVVNDSQTQLTWIINTDVVPKDVVSLQPRDKYIKSVQDVNYVFYFSRWKEYSLSLFYLYSNILDHLFRILLFMASILFLVYMRTLYFNDNTYSIFYILSMHALYIGSLIFSLAYYYHLFFVINAAPQVTTLLQGAFWGIVVFYALAIAVVLSFLHVLFLNRRQQTREQLKKLEEKKLILEQAQRHAERQRRRAESF